MLKGLIVGSAMVMLSVSVVNLSAADEKKHLGQPKYEDLDAAKRGGQDIKSNTKPKTAKQKGNTVTMDPLPVTMDPLPATKTPK
ncbi:MAG: hypothetical protein C3F08_06405 [Candidatus Methylomirabilota bacterium]|nr:MAG: hypothetical protein C3F08_06405 [candidate division NC10 bacterium]